MKGRIFVAGGAGLVGKNLVARLGASGLDFCASHYQTPPSSYCRHYRRMDFTRLEDTTRALEGVHDLVIAAAVTYGVKKMKENPAAPVIPNLRIVGNLLEAARIQKVRRVVFLSSAALYPEAAHPIREEELDLNLPPFRLYRGIGQVTRYLEELCRFYEDQFGIQASILRLSNVYGPHDHFEEDRSHVLPALMRRALNRERPFKVWGSPGVVRDFVYVEDVVEAVMRVLEKGPVKEALNFGCGRPVTIGEAVKTVLEETGHAITPEYDSTAPTAIPYRALDTSRFEKVYGTIPKTSLAEGVRKTLAWYKGSFTKRPAEDSSSPHRVVTGAASGLGRYLVESLGCEGITRKNAGELLERMSASGSDVIIHAAFSMPASLEPADLQRVLEDNLTFTQRLLETPHRQFIYISSIDVYPKSAKPCREDEKIDLRNPQSFYASMKLVAEEMILKHAARPLVLRCSAFLGRGCKKGSFCRIVEDEHPVLSLSEKSRFNYTAFEDVAAFISLAMEKGLTGVYNIASTGTVTLEEVASWVKKKVTFGDYLYDAGEIDNQKAASQLPAFRKSSREVAMNFLSREYEGATGREGK